MLLVAFLLFNAHVATAQNYSDENDNLALPFTPTSISNGNFASGTQWYKISVNGGKYWQVASDEVDCISGLTDFTDANYFCFVGDNTNGFNIYCRSLGTSYILYCASSTSHEALVPTKVSETSTPNTFKLSTNNDGYNFYYPGVKTACINDLHSNGILTLWTNGAAPVDNGCRLNFEAVDASETGGSDEPTQEEGVPFITTTISNGAFAATTHWYTMTIRGGKTITAGNTIECTTVYDISDEHLWCFVGDKASGYQVYSKSYGPSYAMYAPGSSNSTSVYLSTTPTTWSLSTNSNGGYNFYYPDTPNACWNDFGNGNYIALWNSGSAPYDNGSNIVFEEYKSSGSDGEDGEGDGSSPTILPVSGNITYIYLSSGEVEAYPESYISSIENDGQTITIIDRNGGEYTYSSAVATVSDEAPSDLPSITSFKFNNKFNDMLFVDAAGEIVGDSAINVSVGGIGKRLVPSFQLSDKSATVYVDGEVQVSKETSRRFDAPTTYTVAPSGYMMLRELSDSTYAMCPFGRDYLVTVDFLCDHPTNEYGVPIVYITTDDGTIISSKDYYWSGTIRIDGAGYFPDMEETAMNIKGRGNSSWSTPSDWNNPKNPYRIKFDSKQKPLGMTAGKNWNLIAQSISGSMTTNVIGSRISEMVQTDGANHFVPVELYINGDYRGSYCLTEKVGFSNNSIDLDDETNAALLELDTYSYDFSTTTKFDGRALPVTIHNPDFEDDTEVTNLTKQDIMDSFNAFVDAVDNGDDLSPYVDFKSLARFLMLNEMIVNQEIMHPKSTYCYNENILADSLYHFGPTWDFDWGFGYEGSGTYYKSNATFDFYESSTMEARSFIRKLRYSGEEMNKQYYRVWTDFVDNHLDDLIEYCTDYYEVVSKSFEHDNTIWGGGGSSAYKTITNNSIAWLKKRAQYVYDYLSNTLGYADKDYLLPDEPETPEEPDVIEDIASGRTAAPQGIFDMQGRRIECDFQSLPRGIYIVNGRKVLKR